MDKSDSPMTIPAASADQNKLEAILDVHKTSCCIVGGGPCGAMLALLLARQGVPVTLLEMHKDFDREFRGEIERICGPEALEVLAG